MPHPGVAVGQAKEKFDAAVTLTHESTRQFFAGYLQELEAWIERVAKPALAHQHEQALGLLREQHPQPVDADDRAERHHDQRR